MDVDKKDDATQTITTFNKVDWIDKKQQNGTWAPAFPPTPLSRQEEYIERMIRRDKEIECF